MTLLGGCGLERWLIVRDGLSGVLLWVLAAVVAGAGAVLYVVRASSGKEQDHRATVLAAVVAVLVPVVLVVRWAWSRRTAQLPAAAQAAQTAAAEQLAARMRTTWSRQAVEWGIRLPAPVRVRWREGWCAAGLGLASCSVSTFEQGTWSALDVRPLL